MEGREGRRRTVIRHPSSQKFARKYQQEYIQTSVMSDCLDCTAPQSFDFIEASFSAADSESAVTRKIRGIQKSTPFGAFFSMYFTATSKSSPT